MGRTALATAIVPVSRPERRYTPEDLLGLIDDHRYELVDGRLEERAMSAGSSEIALALLMRVGNHVHNRKLGKCLGADCGYQIFPDDPSKVRYADGSFIAKSRLPETRPLLGHARVAPDMALEVISPNELATTVETKRLEYLRAGVNLLWIIYPSTRSVHIHRHDGSFTILGPDDKLSGEDVLPGFVCKVAELFEEV